MSFEKMTAKSQQFLNELAQFYRNKGQLGVSPHHLIARLNGYPVNLWDLYSVVLEMGGSFKVNHTSQWDEVYSRIFKSPPQGANISVALRQIYQRFLMPFEKVNCSNFTNDVVDEEDDDGRMSAAAKESMASYVLHSSFSFPNHQPNGLNSFVNPLNKLFCTLVSGLPNEMDFGLQVANILANSREVDWIADFKFIDVLLECYALYSCCCSEGDVEEDGDDGGNSSGSGSESSSVSVSGSGSGSYRRTQLVSSKRCHCLQRFWSQMCNNRSVIELVFDSADPPSREHSSLVRQKIYNRIKRIAELIKTLSFPIEDQWLLQASQRQPNESSLPAPSQSPAVFAPLSLIKFIALLLSCDDSALNNLSLDILANIAPLTVPSLEQEEYSNVQKYIYKLCVASLVTSNDVHSLNRCLDIISKLLNTSGSEQVNRFIISQLLDNELYGRLTELLTCQHDVGLLVSTLECCLAISEYHPKLLLQDNKNLVKILLNLLNCEASQHFTRLALKKVRILDERQQKSVSEVKPSTSSLPSTGIQLTTLKPNLPTAIQHQPVAGQVMAVDNETFALTWLKNTYEPLGTGTKTQPLRVSEMYAEYVKNCCRSGRRNVVGAQPFAQILKKGFPSISLVNNNQVEGLVPKATLPLVVSSKGQQSGQQPNPLTSPILKAHLSAPPKLNSPTTGTTTPTTATTTTTTTTSTLIKSLLANKLRSNSNTATNASAGEPTTASKCAPTPTPTTVSTSEMSVVTNSSTATKAATTSTITLNTATSNSVGQQPTAICLNSNQPTSGQPVAGSTAVTSLIPTSQEGNVITSVSLASSVSNSVFVTSGLTLSTSSFSTGNVSTLTCSNPTQSVLIGSPQVATSLQSQAPQQFLLVRTIITSQGQQGSLMGVGAAGTPVRLILPATMLAQHQRPIPANVSVNGVASGTSSQSQCSSTSVTSAATTASIASTNDILLKAVLGSGIVTEAPPASPPPAVRTNSVKSSPLLNVLLDKGKLPDFSTMAGTTSQSQTSCVTTSAINTAVTGNTGVNIASMVGNHPKMYILTTKSPLPFKSNPGLQQPVSVSQQLQQPLVIQHQSQSIHQQTVQPIQTCAQMMPSIQELPVQQPMQPQTVNSNSSHTQTPNNTALGQGQLHNQKNSHQNSSTNTSVLSNGEVSVTPVAGSKKTPAANSNDLSPIKDIRKAVDEATRLISKRPGEDNTIAAKKAKLNSTCSSNSVTTTATKNVPLKANCQQPKGGTKPVTTCATISAVSVAASSPAKASTSTATATTMTAPVFGSPAVAHPVKCAKTLEYICEWHGCKRSFARPQYVYRHVHREHVLNDASPVTTMMCCMWGGPEGLGPGCQSKRPKLSLMTHLHDFHCNPDIVHQIAIRNQQLGTSGSTNLGLPQPPPAHPGYAQNAALLAIKRHAINYVEPLSLPPVTATTPLTVSIRLTAALILRNLAQHSIVIQNTLQSYEPYLSELCVSEGRDESRTIAQCLAVIVDRKGRWN